MKQLWVVVLALSVVGCEDGSASAPEGSRAGGDTVSTTEAQRLTSQCFEQVLGQLDPNNVDPQKIQEELEKCFNAAFDGGIQVPRPPRPNLPFDGGFPSLPSFDAGGFPPFPSFDAGGFPPFPSFDAGGFPPFPSFDAGRPGVPGGPDFSGVGKECPANGDCGPNLKCLNALNETLPSKYAVCIPG
jgi:hypothetical protein